MNERLCCQYQELILECIYKQEFQEIWKSFEGWARSGKISKNGDIKFDCANCSEFYRNIISLTGVDANSKETNSENIKELGCCQSISIIKNLDDEVEKPRLEIWLSIFKDIMCFDCSEIIKLASVEVILKGGG
jgi:hypothetical protein